MQDSSHNASGQNETDQPHRTAILVVHGIGQQQPLQALDAFVRGLRGALSQKGEAISLTHFRQNREDVFDHFVRLESKTQSNAKEHVQDLDIYEFYWASLTQGKATFWQVVSWFRTTVLTPFKRFAYNLPLAFQQERNTPANWRFFNELWRVIWIPIMGLFIMASASYLVTELPTLSRDLANAFSDTYSKLLSVEGPRWKTLVAAVVLFGATIASIAILWSLPEQLRDIYRLRRLAPGLTNLLVEGVRTAYFATTGNWPSRAIRSLSGLRQGFHESLKWQAEIKARRQFFWLSVVALGGFLGLISSIVLSQTPFSLALTASLKNIQWCKLGLMGAAIGLGFLIKKIFVDFLGDVALYVTADETSAFYRTRFEILELATKKLRSLLTNPNYSSVVVAGHSLGSVIAYDTISRLRLETDLPNSATINKQPSLPIEKFQRLKLLVTFGSPLDKVLYFFRQRIKPYETVRGHILNELHGFRRHPDLLTHDATIHDDRQAPSDENLYWLNCYSRMDPVSARLDFYTNVNNLHRWYPMWGFAHTDYWHDEEFYKVILRTLNNISDVSRNFPDNTNTALTQMASSHDPPQLHQDDPAVRKSSVEVDSGKPYTNNNILDVSKWLAGLTTGAVGWLVINARPPKLFCPDPLGEDIIKHCLQAFSGNNVYSMIFWTTVPDWLRTIRGLTDTDIIAGSWNLRMFVLSLIGFLLSILFSIALRSLAAPPMTTHLKLFCSQVLFVGLGGLCVMGLAMGGTEGQGQLSLKVDWGRPPKVEIPAEIKPIKLDPQSIEQVGKAKLGINENDMTALRAISFGLRKPEFELEMKKGQSISLDQKDTRVIATGSVTLAPGQVVTVDTKNSQMKVTGAVVVDPNNNRVQFETNKNQVVATGTVVIAPNQTIGLDTKALVGVENELKTINTSVQALDPDRRSRGQRDAR